jgi:hypothetical protein
VSGQVRIKEPTTKACRLIRELDGESTTVVREEAEATWWERLKVFQVFPRQFVKIGIDSPIKQSREHAVVTLHFALLELLELLLGCVLDESVFIPEGVQKSI